MILQQLALPQNWPGDYFFKSRKPKLWERLNSNFKVNIRHFFTLLNNLFTSFLNLFISSIELRTFLYLITYLFLLITYLFL